MSPLPPFYQFPLPTSKIGTLPLVRSQLMNLCNEITNSSVEIETNLCKSSTPATPPRSVKDGENGTSKENILMDEKPQITPIVSASPNPPTRLPTKMTLEKFTKVQSALYALCRECCPDAVFVTRTTSGQEGYFIEIFLRW